MPQSWRVCVIFDRPTRILLIVFVLTLSFAWGDSRCLSHQHNLDGKRCCRKCAPGSGTWSPCSYSNDTICRPCSHGVSFSGTHSHADKCRPCSKLPDNAHYIRKCNVTHDAVWQCNEDFYRDSDQCNPCHKCHPGWGASRPCTRKYNTICRQCPNGTFSDLFSGTSGCRVCTKCNEYQQMAQSCSSMLDTTCIGKLNGRPRTPVSNYPVDGTTKSTIRQDADMILIYCAVPGIIIVALLVYVLIRRRGKTLGHRNHKEDHFRSVMSHMIYTDRDGNTVTMTTKLRNLPSSKQKEIEKTLQMKVAGRPSWMSLARELGYNKERINSMEAKAKQQHISTSRCLLQEWSKSQNATVGVLIRALKSIGRIDIVKILQGQPTFVKEHTLVKIPTIKDVSQPVCV